MDAMKSGNATTKRRMKGDIIFAGLNMWIEIILLIVMMFIMISVIDVISGYRIGFLHLMGLK